MCRMDSTNQFDGDSYYALQGDRNSIGVSNAQTDVFSQVPGQVLMEDDEIEEPTGLNIEEITKNCEVVANQAVSPSEVIQVLPSAMATIQSSLDQSTDTFLNLNGVIPIGVVEEEHYDSSEQFSSQGDFKYGNKKSIALRKLVDSEMLNCDSHNSLENLVMDSEAKLTKRKRNLFSKNSVAFLECDLVAEEGVLLRSRDRKVYRKSTKKATKFLGQVLLEDDELEPTELNVEELTNTCDAIADEAVSSSEVMQVLPLATTTMQSNLDQSTDKIHILNSVVPIGDEQHYESSGKFFSQGDVKYGDEKSIPLRKLVDCKTLNCDSNNALEKLIIDSETTLMKRKRKSSKNHVVCPECGLVLKGTGRFRSHYKKVHNKSTKKAKKLPKEEKQTDRLCYCPACAFTTVHRDKMDKHIQNHVDNGYHPSGKKRNSPDQPLQRQHHNAEEYRCELCPYVCTIEEALIKHQKHHFFAKKFTLKVSCKICGKDRSNDTDLKKHMRKHIKDNNFICDLCGFFSAQLKKVIQHRRMHTGERPHLCPFCQCRSARRDNLRSHVRRMHKKENIYGDTFNPMVSFEVQQTLS